MGTRIKPSIVIALSLSVALPSIAQADWKDDLAKGAVGLIILESAKQSQKQSNTQKNTQKDSKGTKKKSTQSGFSRGERIQIQNALNAMGYNAGVADGALGKKSRAAITRFQGAMGYSQTGALTRPQFNHLVSVAPAAGSGNAFTQANPDRQLNPNEVSLLQQSLAKLGYYFGSIDGQAGKGTANAVSSFLTQNGHDPYQTSPLKALVLAGQKSNTPIPAHLVQEASSGHGGSGVFDEPSTGSGQQQASDVFGAPQSGQSATQSNEAAAMFGGTQTGSTDQQQQGGEAAQGQSQSGLDVFAASPQPADASQQTGNATATTQQPQSNLDVFSLDADQAETSDTSSINAAQIPENSEQSSMAELFQVGGSTTDQAEVTDTATEANQNQTASQGGLDVFELGSE
ncbi:peptidoglycan-binding domain-containing protein [Roseovarius sp. EL26]|uniref:peptidoglycan-binding domain-containing protein n=1 Tax=Roseovarius sp. EL26 TaxID=2126672 RepID=UPI000EA16C50|nr:peptidoglycan-binding domain-containing protein [Roseovarius sp. EL26]